VLDALRMDDDSDMDDEVDDSLNKNLICDTDSE